MIDQRRTKGIQIQSWIFALPVETLKTRIVKQCGRIKKSNGPSRQDTQEITLPSYPFRERNKAETIGLRTKEK